jgi:hypothetical protein
VKYTQEQKQVLARLLATENITVEHRNVSTAMFDVQNRTLLLPTWDSMPEDVYDMLVGHEVGHALFTPTDMDDLQTKIDGIDPDHPGRVKTLFNIVEDARIEKKMKRKFPGLRRDFHNGYKDFLQKGLFGDPESLNRKLIDKINIHFKCGSLGPQYEFSPDEQQLIDRIEKVETFEDVADIVKDLYEFVLGDVPDMADDMLMQQQMEERGDCNGWEEETQKSNSGSGTDSADGDEKDTTDSDGTDGDRERDGDDTRESTQSEKSGSDKQEMEDEKGKESKKYNSKVGGRGNRNNLEDQFKSDTQDAMDDFIESSYDPTMLPDMVVNIPKVDSNRYIENYSSVLSNLDEYYHEKIYTDKWFVGALMDSDISKEQYNQALVDGYKSWKKSVNSSVNFMAKEFEMKKSADQYARASVNKTGILNTNKIHQYRYNEDIFRRITILPDGKDHAMILVIDWSGSMDASISNTIHQAMTLVLFCKKVNIPFEVYCFSDNPGAYRDVIKPLQQKDYEVDDLYVDYFVMRNMFSSRMTTKELERSMTYFYAMSIGFSYGGLEDAYGIELNYGYARHLVPTDWSLCGTPLNNSLIIMKDYLERYRKDNRSTIINVILLTDGDSATSILKITEDDEIAHNASDIGYSGYVQYDDSDETKEYYREKLYVDAKVANFCHSNVNVRLKDPYSNTTEYISPSSDRQGVYRTSWCSTEHNNMTNSLIRSLGNISRVNVVGFFVANGKYNVRNAVSTHFFSRRDHGHVEKYDEMMKDFRKSKYLVNEEHAGYDIFFILSGGSDLELETGGLDDDLKGESKRRLTTAFKKHSKAKLQSRVFLTKFIDYISKENF